MAEKVKKKGRARVVIPVVIVGVLVLFAAASMVAIHILFAQNFPRVEKPQYSHRLTYEEVADTYGRTQVTFPSGENQLTGYVYGGDNDRGLVVISHGLGNGAEAYLAHTLYFVDQGYRVLAFDNTGTWGSEGKDDRGLSQSVLDLDAALTFVEGDSGLSALPVYLFGHSWGGYAVAAIFNYDHDIAASVSMAGYNTPMEMLAEQSRSVLGPLAAVEYPFILLTQAMRFGSVYNLSAVDGINRTDTPVFVIHDTEDKAIQIDGASIYAHRGEITNPNVCYKVCDLTGEDTHSDLFLSEDARTYRAELQRAYQELVASSGGEVPEEAKRTWCASSDHARYSELDPAFMQEIMDFYAQASKET